MIPNTLSTAPTVRPQTKRITVNTSLSWFLWFPLAALHFRAKTNSNLPNITIAYYNITFRDTARKRLLFSFSASVFLLSHLRTTPPHTWPEMDGDRTIATWLFVGQTMQKHTNVLGWKSRENAATSIFAIIFQVNTIVHRGIVKRRARYRPPSRETMQFINNQNWGSSRLCVLWIAASFLSVSIQREKKKEERYILTSLVLTF